MGGQEDLLPTHHPKILRATRANVDRDAIRRTLEESRCTHTSRTWSEADLFDALRRFVPEYIPYAKEITTP